MELMRRHGPVLVRRLHRRDVLFVADLDLVTDLSDEARFAKAVGPALENVREFAGDGLFTAYNDEPNWARAHDILMPAFALGGPHGRGRCRTRPVPRRDRGPGAGADQGRPARPGRLLLRL
ncbi:hypothetical protein [Streptomyces sp. NPDC093984]|uniref:hypothetical protein n=1 Tax=Streptomyces sp. NPDC093984 TaxID=3366052 RepID=UPI00382DE370